MGDPVGQLFRDTSLSGDGLLPTVLSIVSASVRTGQSTVPLETMQRMMVNQMILEQGNFYPPNQWPTPAPGTPELLTTRDVLRFGTMNGAKALQLDHKVGSLTPGKEADIIILDATAINVAPLNHVPGAVVSLMDRTNVETVIVAGKVRKWKGRLLDVDLRRLRQKLEASRDYLFNAAGIPVDLFGPN